MRIEVLRGILGWRRLSKVGSFDGTGEGLAGWLPSSTPKLLSPCGSGPSRRWLGVFLPTEGIPLHIQS